MTRPELTNNDKRQFIGIVKAILGDTGSSYAKVTDHNAIQVTPPPEGKTAFGEQLVAQPTPIIQIDFPYDTNLGVIDVYENQSGTVTHSNRQITLQTGAAANSSAEIRSKRILKYNPSQGGMARFTAKFTTGVANSTQIAGIGNESDGLYFGYNGTSFGILHRKNGSPEVRTLTVSTGSSHAENITITLDGVAVSVAVTASGSTATTAKEIAAADYSDTGKGWTAYLVGSKVEFKSWDAATHSGTFSLTGTSAVGTFAQNVVGAAATENWTAQASWNGDDIFDGNGLTGVTLDPTKGNVYQINYQWLGYGVLSFYCEDPDDGVLHLVHAIEYANANTTPSLGDPSLALMAKVENTSNTSNLTLQSPCFAAFIEGKPEYIGVRLGVRATKTDVTTALRPILTIRQGLYKNSKVVQTFGKIMQVAISASHVKPIAVAIIENGALTGGSFARIHTTSAMELDTSATAITGGTEIFAIPVGVEGNQYISLAEDYYSYIFQPGKKISFCAITSSGTGGEATVALKLLERI